MMKKRKHVYSWGFFCFFVWWVFLQTLLMFVQWLFLRYENSIKEDISIIKYDKEEEEPQAIKQNESGTLRLSRTSSKDFDVYGPIHI